MSQHLIHCDFRHFTCPTCAPPPQTGLGRSHTLRRQFPHRHLTAAPSYTSPMISRHAPPASTSPLARSSRVRRRTGCSWCRERRCGGRRVRRVSRGAMGDVWRQVACWCWSLGGRRKLGMTPPRPLCFIWGAPHNGTSQLLTVTFACVRGLDETCSPKLSAHVALQRVMTVI